MPHLNVEIKARVSELDTARQWLHRKGARYVGLDHQIDTYFPTPEGRLKLREGTIEQSLIFYKRADQAGPKKSEVFLYEAPSDPGLKALLSAALGVWVTVDKKREIYFLENVKIHLDKVQGLGTFLEIEAIDREGTIGEDRLFQQCRAIMGALEIEEDALESGSYSDLLAGNKGRFAGN